MQVQCVQNEDDFLSLRDEWNELLSRSAQASYFLTHEWFGCCWRELRGAADLRVFVVRKENNPLLIAPWMSFKRRHKRLPARCLSFIEHPETQLAGMIIGSGSETEDALERLIGYLLEESPGGWDLLSLDKIPVGSETARLLENGSRAFATSCELKPSHEAVALPLSGQWDDYLNSQSTRFRKTLRNVVNRVQRLGSVKVDSYSGAGPSTGAIQKVFSISDASWKMSNGVAITSSAARMRFFEDLLSRATTAGGLRIWILEANGTPIASEIQIVDSDVVYALRSDFDEHYADSSPGTYLQVEILKSLFGSGCREYHMGVGLNAYKTRWTEQRRKYVKFVLFKNSLYGRLLRSIDQVQFPSVAEYRAARFLNDFFSGRLTNL